MCNLNNNPSITKSKNGELTYRDSTNVSNKVLFPVDLFDSVNTIIRENITSQGFSLNKDKVDELWKVTIKPEFQKGINNESLSITKGSLEIRNAKTGLFVGKAQLTEPSALSNISRNIASISGQIQMAEISKKLDVILDKIDELGQFLWKEKVSQVHSINSVIEQAIESLPNKNALERINDCIKDLMFLSNFIEKTIEEVLSRKIEYNLISDFIDGLKVWELGKKYRNEYNEKYNNAIISFINEYGFLLDLYFQTLGLIGTCYQITNEYHHAYKYFRKIETNTRYFSAELANKLIYLLNVEGISVNDDSLLHISKRLEKRKLPRAILQEINSIDTIVDKIKNMHKGLVSQFEEIQISYDVDTLLLMGDKNND